MFQLNTKEKSLISKMYRDSAYLLSGKTNGKMLIYYHLLKILLKINKTNENKTQQKSPSFLFHPPYLFFSSISLSAGDSLRRSREGSYLHVNCERQGLSSAAHYTQGAQRETIFMCKFQPLQTLCALLFHQCLGTIPPFQKPTAPRTLDNSDHIPPPNFTPSSPRCMSVYTGSMSLKESTAP